jgi:hypothetical protein
LESWVPDGQHAPTQLLVILQEKEGGDFLANTARSLGTPGHERTILPLGLLQLARWSKDADGLLDLSRVSQIRVGWGGYCGSAGQEIEFRLTAPRMARAASW